MVLGRLWGSVGSFVTVWHVLVASYVYIRGKRKTPLLYQPIRLSVATSYEMKSSTSSCQLPKTWRNKLVIELRLGRPTDTRYTQRTPYIDKIHFAKLREIVKCRQRAVDEAQRNVVGGEDDRVGPLGYCAVRELVRGGEVGSKKANDLCECKNVFGAEMDWMDAYIGFGHLENANL